MVLSPNENVKPPTLTHSLKYKGTQKKMRHGLKDTRTRFSDSKNVLEVTSHLKVLEVLKGFKFWQWLDPGHDCNALATG